MSVASLLITGPVRTMLFAPVTEMNGALSSNIVLLVKATLFTPKSDTSSFALANMYELLATWTLLTP